MTVRDRRRVLADAGAEVPAEAKAEALRVAGRLGAGPPPPHLRRCCAIRSAGRNNNVANGGPCGRPGGVRVRR
jgi:hypothetical protein